MNRAELKAAAKMIAAVDNVLDEMFLGACEIHSKGIGIIARNQKLLATALMFTLRAKIDKHNEEVSLNPEGKKEDLIFDV